LKILDSGVFIFWCYPVSYPRVRLQPKQGLWNLAHAVY